EWKTIPAKQAIGRILKANGVFAYNPNSRKIFEKEFRAYELDLRSPLTHAERQRRGLIIFLSPKKDPVSSPSGLVLIIDGLAQPATLKLNLSEVRQCSHSHPVSTGWPTRPPFSGWQNRFNGFPPPRKK